MPLRVLLTGDDHYAPLAAARALRRAGYEPWVAIDMDDAFVTRSRAVAGVVRTPIPAEDPEGFSDAARDAAQRLRVGAVLPGDESALIALARSRDTFAMPVGAPAPETVARATEKALLDELAAAAGLATPPTQGVTRADLESGAAAVAYPAILKPVRSKVDGVYAKPVRVESRAGLRAALDRVPGESWLVQPYLGSNLRAICGVAWEGRIVCALHQVTHRLYPADVGLGAYSETVARDEAIEDSTSRLIEALTWSGPFQLQFVEHRGTAYLIDLNPRIYGSLALAVRAGLNLPAVWVELLLGGSPAPSGYAIGIRYRAEELDARALAAALSRGRLGDAAAIARPHRRTVHAVFSWRDPAPAGLILAKVGRRLRRPRAANV